MSSLKKILIVLFCVLLLTAGWAAAIFSKTDTDRQRELITAAQAYLADGIYVKAVPLLEEAADYQADLTLEAEELLKQAYIPLLEQSGYPRKYTNLLERQMGRKDAGPEVFLEAAKYYLGRLKEQEAFTVLKNGIEKTGSQELTEFYEANRYVYRVGRGAYQEATAFLNGYIQVQQEGLWGLARADGSLCLPCEYDFLSTYYNGELIVQRDGVLSGVDLNGNRLALYKGEPVSGVTNYNEGRLAVKQSQGWVLALDTLETGNTALEEIGTYSNGGAAAKQNGKWGVVKRNGRDWWIEPAYDGIVCDDLGRCWSDEAVFVRQGEQVLLLVDGEQVGGPFEDARPFAGGWAAVKQNGLWGFIDREGTVQIDCQFDDARSFTMHLAAVQKGRNWGYVGLNGRMVIEPSFLEAKAFEKGSAPVRTVDGWQFITLLEYESGLSGI